MAPPNQSLRRRAYCKIYVGGRDVTDKLDPYLISVEVIDILLGYGGGGFDRCNLELDDRDARLEVPDSGTIIRAEIGWAGTGPQLDVPPPTPPGSERQLGWENVTPFVFNGVLDTVESGFARGGGGRRMWIEAKGADLLRDGKTGMLYSLGEGKKIDTSGMERVQGGVGQYTFGQFIDKIGAAAGYGNIMISPEISNIARDWWMQGHGESFHSILDRLSSELGYRFKIQGNSVFVIGDTAALSGFASTNIDAYWGVNLISWRIRPYIARPQYGKNLAGLYDTVNSKFREVVNGMSGGAPFNNASATSVLPNLAPNRQVGDQSNNARASEGEDVRGTGWAMINGEPRAAAGSFLNIVGARPGVDAKYLITEADHKYIRAGGYTTRCTLERPQFSPYPYVPRPGEQPLARQAPAYSYTDNQPDAQPIPPLPQPSPVPQIQALTTAEK